jgi:hypothetical protein
MLKSPVHANCPEPDSWKVPTAPAVLPTPHQVVEVTLPAVKASVPLFT